jgi:2-polyprenyl-6-methoxyphenol hydroxylase-like FAD-dependent oxidoreductase
MDVQLVIGAGAIGTTTAQLLADRGERVRRSTEAAADLSTRPSSASPRTPPTRMR